MHGPIDPSRGRGGLDFDPSGKSGFYVTTDPIQAADWARKQEHPTITQFNIPNSELAKMDIKAFDTANGEWANFVTEGRQGTLSHTYDTRGNLILATDPKRKPPVMIGTVILSSQRFKFGRIAISGQNKTLFSSSLIV